MAGVAQQGLGGVLLAVFSCSLMVFGFGMFWCLGGVLCVFFGVFSCFRGGVPVAFWL